MLTLKLDYAKPVKVASISYNPGVSIDFNGKILSRFNDDKWTYPLSHMRPNSRSNVVWPAESDDAKQLAFLRLTHGKALGCRSAFTMANNLANLQAFCSEKRVPLRHLSRYPQVVIDFCSQTTGNNQRPTFDRIKKITSVARIALAAKDDLGWIFLERDQIEALSRIETLAHHQYPVIPRRIHQAVDDAAHAILKGYTAVADELDEVLAIWLPAGPKRRKIGCKANWARLVDDRPALKHQLHLYTGSAVHPIRTYFTVVRSAAFWAIAAGTCARKSEILDLRHYCLRREQIGDNSTYLLTGATTKTQENPYAIWVASPKVAPAVQALERVLASYKAHHPKPPNLTDRLFQTLDLTFGGPYSRTKEPIGLINPGDALSKPGLEKLAKYADVVITQHDWQEAKQLTPSLDEDKYRIGQPWRVSAHQIRRTVLVRAAASGLVSLDSLSFQAKHQTWQMTAYYCRNYWHLASTQPDHPLVTGTQESDATEFTRIYADSYNQDRSTVLEDDRFFSPYGVEHKRKVIEATPLLSLDDIRRLTQSGALKRNTLGLCAQSEYCEWQKAITVRGCMTRSEGKPCSKAVIDSSRLRELNALHESVSYDLDALSARDKFAREQKQADLAAIQNAIELVEQHRSSHV